ncbi:MAG: Si-specific NAD(P)(+) transhydrogenase [Gammaproteobacteria bacterium]|nr:Si-specific NAD(P)(+) transhydrogenase [Gammaproteobacteria bacterium]
MNSRRYDAIVIGTGPAGEGAAMSLAKAGKAVAAIEKYLDVGGGCTHWGTIPSKALRHCVQQLADYRVDPLFQQNLAYLSLDYVRLLKSADGVIAKQTSMRKEFYNRNRVDILPGHARFIDDHTVGIETDRGATEKIGADYFVIATGSRPYHPPDVNFAHACVHDSDTILRLTDSNARSITIYGAGVVGCEYASIFGNLGFKVNLVNTRDRLLSFLDDEITEALGYHLRDCGVLIRHNEQYEKVEPVDDAVILHCQSGKKFKNDLLLWANGRTGNTQDMGLEELSIEINHRGQIEVNENLQTNHPHIYAAGDVIGQPSLASASYDQGRFVGTHIASGSGDRKLIQDIPTGIYTSPEISSLGRTERELTAEKIPYEVGRAMFRSIARAQITGHTVGMVKLLFHPQTLEIFGIHCFGEQASEIIHIGQAIMSQSGKGNTLQYFVDTTFNYPTMAEAYRVAALNGLNRIF